MKRHNGFTLIELVVIILVLGILAGNAATKFLKTTTNATDNGLKQTLAIVRDAIDLYTNSHLGTLPPCTGNGADFKAALASSLRNDFPTSPVGALNSDVTPATGSPTTGDASPTAGWKFNTSTGEFICNSQAT